MTVRSRIKSAQMEILKGGELPPQRASQLLMELTALIGNCTEEIRYADAEYAKVLLHELETSEKANRARIKAECSPEYLRRREARDAHELVLEMVRSLKIYLKAQQEELRLAK